MTAFDSGARPDLTLSVSSDFNLDSVPQLLPERSPHARTGIAVDIEQLLRA